MGFIELNEFKQNLKLMVTVLKPIQLGFHLVLPSSTVSSSLKE